MNIDPTKTHTPCTAAICNIFHRIAAEIIGDIDRDIKAYLGGGAAVHFYTGHRIPRDVEAIFVPPIIGINDLVEIFHDENGRQHVLTYDLWGIAPVHPDYAKNSYFLIKTGKLELFILSPLDLAVPKMIRFWEIDRDDINELVRRGFFTLQQLRQKVLDFLPQHPVLFNSTYLRKRLNDTSDKIEDME